jgi:hypothetical protein
MQSDSRLSLDSVPDHRVDLETAKRYVVSVINGLLDRGWYADAFGYACAREGKVDGYAGPDVEAYARVIGGPDVWPPGLGVDEWDLTGLLRAIRFYHRDVAAPLRYLDHTAYGCGRHPRSFDGELGRARFRDAINEVLGRLEPRMQITSAGIIVTAVPPGLSELLNVEQTGTASDRYRTAIAAATSKFQGATFPADQKDAVRDLADLLELLRPDARRLFGRPDEAALFNIANNFAIRHGNLQQRADYETSVWMPWIFYWYLAAVHAIVAALDHENT